MSAAAGTVVTEMNTPTSAPLFADGQRQDAGDPGEDRHHERPAVGCGDEAGLRPVGVEQFGAEPAEQPPAERCQAAVTAMATAKPTDERDRRAPGDRPGRRWTTATASAASGANSGPEHHRADGQDRRVVDDRDARPAASRWSGTPGRRPTGRTRRPSSGRPAPRPRRRRRPRAPAPRPRARRGRRPRRRTSIAMPPSSVDAQLAQRGDEPVGRLPGDVGEHEVAGGETDAPGRTARCAVPGSSSNSSRTRSVRSGGTVTRELQQHRDGVAV